MTKKNLIIVIILLAIIDLVAAGWYMSRRIEASGRSQSLFDTRDSTQVIAEADTVATASQADQFTPVQINSYYFVSNNPAIQGDETSYYTSTKHVKVRWPLKVNGNDELTELNRELIKKAFGNAQSQMKDARYVYMKSPNFNRPVDEDEYRTLVKAPKVFPVYGNVSQVLVYPYMTSQRLLVMEIDKVEYNGSTTIENSTYIHYDRIQQRLLSRLDILVADVNKETKLLKLINNKIDELNRGRSEDNLLQHALNVPAEVRCSRKGIVFQYKSGIISSSPIEILVDYGKLEPFLTEEFKQMQENNEGYWVYNGIEAEPIHKNPSPAALAAPVNKKATDVKPRQTSPEKYNAAKRRSGYRGRAVRRHSTRRRR